jgi:hypothetical protein
MHTGVKARTVVPVVPQQDKNDMFHLNDHTYSSLASRTQHHALHITGQERHVPPRRTHVLVVPPHGRRDPARHVRPRGAARQHCAGGFAEVQCESQHSHTTTSMHTAHTPCMRVQDMHGHAVLLDNIVPAVLQKVNVSRNTSISHTSMHDKHAHGAHIMHACARHARAHGPARQHCAGGFAEVQRES